MSEALSLELILSDEVRRLLATGQSAKIRGFISKTGKPFDAKLVIKDNKAVFDFSVT